MLTRKFLNFLADEDGGYTAWFVVWFALYIAMGGLAVDVGDAFRNQTLLQSTADAAALAGAYSLPNTSAAVNNAVMFARANMEVAVNGNVVMPSEVFTGNWDRSSSTFNLNGTPRNAVYVIARRGTANENPLATNLLRIAGIDWFDIKTEAVAVSTKSECEREGLLAMGDMEIGSGNSLVNDICIHGQHGIKIQNGNIFESGVTVTTGHEENFDQMEKRLDPKNNDGLNLAYKGEGDMDLQMPGALPQIVAAYCQCIFEGTAPPTNNVLNHGTLYEAPILPSYHDTNKIVPIALKDFNNLIPSLAVPVSFDANMVPTLGTNADGSTIHGNYTTYYVNCDGPGGNHIKIGDGIALRDMTIISECFINVGNSLLTNVTLIGLGEGSNVGKSTLNFSSKAVLGLDDGCSTDGDVRLYSLKSIHTAAQMQIYGVQMIAVGDIHISAQANGTAGIAAEAGGDIKVTSQSSYGLCKGNIDGIYASWGVRLVR